MFAWLKQSPEKKLRRRIGTKYAEAQQMQRNGRMHEHASLMAEITHLKDELVELGQLNA
jgi:hypothetical protein